MRNDYAWDDGNCGTPEGARVCERNRLRVDVRLGVRRVRAVLTKRWMERSSPRMNGQRVTLVAMISASFGSGVGSTLHNPVVGSTPSKEREEVVDLG